MLHYLAKTCFRHGSISITGVSSCFPWYGFIPFSMRGFCPLLNLWPGWAAFTFPSRVVYRLCAGRHWQLGSPLGQCCWKWQILVDAFCAFLPHNHLSELFLRPKMAAVYTLVRPQGHNIQLLGHSCSVFRRPGNSASSNPSQCCPMADLTDSNCVFVVPSAT